MVPIIIVDVFVMVLRVLPEAMLVLVLMAVTVLNINADAVYLFIIARRAWRRCGQASSGSIDVTVLWLAGRLRLVG